MLRRTVINIYVFAERKMCDFNQFWKHRLWYKSWLKFVSFPSQFCLFLFCLSPCIFVHSLPIKSSKNSNRPVKLVALLWLMDTGMSGNIILHHSNIIRSLVLSSHMISPTNEITIIQYFLCWTVPYSSAIGAQQV